MIFNTTHTNKEAKKLTNDLLGFPFTFIPIIQDGWNRF